MRNGKDSRKVLAGRIGGLVTSSRTDSLARTANARAAFLKRFWPDDPSLSEQEAGRRAEAALKAHMARLACASIKKRKATLKLPKSPASIGGEESNA